MKFVLATPAVLAFAALSVNAQTIETDYPRVVPAGPVVAAVAPAAARTDHSMSREDPLYLIQSNAEGPRVAPGYSAENRELPTREEVQAHAQVNVRWNAPDLRS